MPFLLEFIPVIVAAGEGLGVAGAAGGAALGAGGAAGVVAGASAVAAGATVLETGGLLATLGSAALQVGLALGAGYVATLLQGKPNINANGQILLRQTSMPRRRSYGLVKVGGIVGFEETKTGNLYILALQGSGEIDGIQEHWLGDTQVLLDANGWVITEPWGTDTGAGTGVTKNIIQIQSNLGTADQVAWPLLTTEFSPGFSSTDRWIGVPTTLLLFKGVKKEDISKFYPQGVPPYRAVQRSALVYDPREDEQDPDGDPDRPRDNGWTYSNNAALCILDYMRHPDGFKRTVGVAGRQMVPISKFYVPDFIAFADRCDEPRVLKAGGTEPKWRLGGTYDLSMAPKDVLQGMLNACDADVYIRLDGKIGIRGGGWTAPTISFSKVTQHQLKPGARKLSAFNVLQTKYTSAAHDYQTVDADPWRNDANITLRGEELAQPLDLTWCPSHAQARQVSKIFERKNNPAWQGPITMGPIGLRALEECVIDFAFDELAIDTSFLVRNLEPAPTLASTKLNLVALDATAYAWDPAAEEGTAPAVPVSTASDNTIPKPDGLLVVQEERIVNGTVIGSVGVVTWTTSAITTLSYEGEYRKSDGSGGWMPWTPLAVANGQERAVSDVLDDGGRYEFHVRAISPTGRPSDYSDSTFLTVIAGSLLTDDADDPLTDDADESLLEDA